MVFLSMYKIETDKYDIIKWKMIVSTWLILIRLFWIQQVDSLKSDVLGPINYYLFKKHFLEKTTSLKDLKLIKLIQAKEYN